MTNQTYKTTQLLDDSAAQLAQRHRQRLHRMTHEAVYGQRPHRMRHGAWWRPALATGLPLAVFVSVALLLQPATQPQAPDTVAQVTPALPAKVPAKVPAWVQDTGVPLAVLENIEFYQWLEHELDKKHHG